MNSLSTVTLYTLLVLGAVALMNVAAYQNQDTNSANSVGGADPGTSTSGANCDRSEVYSRCNANPSCQKTCDNYEEPNACSSSGTVANDCYPGCVCKNGFVRVAKGDRCIPTDKCEGRVRH